MAETTRYNVYLYDHWVQVAVHRALTWEQADRAMVKWVESGPVVDGHAVRTVDWEAIG